MKTKFVSKYGKPITASRSAMRPTPITGPPNSLAQAQSQIQASPMPFQNPQGPLAPVQSHQGFKQKQVHARASAGGTRPGANTANAPRSDPSSQGQMNTRVGYSSNYAADYNPSTHPVAKAKAKVRFMRNAIPGTKPLVKPMDSGDFAEGAALYRKEHGRL